jgi:hypothetical protein
MLICCCCCCCCFHQVANYLEFSAEDGEAERKKALGEVVELGQQVWVKVRAACLYFKP